MPLLSLWKNTKEVSSLGRKVLWKHIFFLTFRKPIHLPRSLSLFSSFLHYFLAREAGRFLICPSQPNLISSSKPVLSVGFSMALQRWWWNPAHLGASLCRLWSSHSDVPVVRCHPITTTKPMYGKKEARLCVMVKCRLVASGAVRRLWRWMSWHVCGSHLFPHAWQSAVWQWAGDLTVIKTLWMW
jgi:hypothetical protein